MITISISGDSDLNATSSWSVSELFDEFPCSDGWFSSGEFPCSDGWVSSGGGGVGVELMDGGSVLCIFITSGLFGHTSGTANGNSPSERLSRYSFQKNGFITTSSTRSSVTPV